MKQYYSILVFLLYATSIQQSTASQFQSIASIQEATRDYINSNLTFTSDYKFKIGQIDNRLKLPLCPEALKVSPAKATLKAGRNAIRVRCQSTKKWTIYTSAIIYIYKDVIVLSQPIKRGELYSKHNLQLEKKELSTLRSGFFTDVKNIINKQASRNLSIGSVISQSNMTEPKIIKRGEKVTINISNSNFAISATGIALMDGKKNQNIRIKNIKSKQVIYATVVKQGQVVVSF